MVGKITNLRWSSDWDGEDVGYPDILDVGLYESYDLGCMLYLDTETGEIIDVMQVEED